MGLVGRRKLSPVVGLPCVVCRRPTGNVNRALCETCLALPRNARVRELLENMDEPGLAALFPPELDGAGAVLAAMPVVARAPGAES